MSREHEERNRAPSATGEDDVVARGEAPSMVTAPPHVQRLVQRKVQRRAIQRLERSGGALSADQDKAIQAIVAARGWLLFAMSSVDIGDERARLFLGDAAGRLGDAMKRIDAAALDDPKNQAPHYPPVPDRAQAKVAIKNTSDWIERAKLHLIGSDALGAVAIATEKLRLANGEIDRVDAAKAEIEDRIGKTAAAEAASDRAAPERGAAEKPEVERQHGEKKGAGGRS